jgi:hypothetical protein
LRVARWWFWFGLIGAGHAEELWIIPPLLPAALAPAALPLRAGVRIHLGEHFPASGRVLEPDRIVRFDLIQSDAVSVLSRYRVDGRALVSDIEVPAGGCVLALSTGPRILRLEAEEFNRHLLRDGVLQVYEPRRRYGQLDRPASERRRRHAKALLTAPGPRGDLFLRPVGAPLEIVPLLDPTQLAAGSLLEVRVLSRGRPAPGLTILASGEAPQSSQFSAVTDDYGEAAFPPDRAGLWYIHAVDMRRLQGDPEADYECEWTTLTFAVQ